MNGENTRESVHEWCVILSETDICALRERVYVRVRENVCVRVHENKLSVCVCVSI